MARFELRNVNGLLSRNEWLTVGGALLLSVVAGLLTAFHVNAVITFVIAGGALAILAALVGIGTDQIGAEEHRVLAGAATNLRAHA